MPAVTHKGLIVDTSSITGYTTPAVLARLRRNLRIQKIDEPAVGANRAWKNLRCRGS